MSKVAADLEIRVDTSGFTEPVDQAIETLAWLDYDLWEREQRAKEESDDA